MLMSKSNRNFARWLAMLAMALNALWPLVANAKPGYADLIQDICGVGPAKSLKTVAATAQLLGAKHLLAHCALCSAGSDNPAALAPARPDAALAITPAETAAPDPVLLPHAALRYSAARPRGPPAVS